MYLTRDNKLASKFSDNQSLPDQIILIKERYSQLLNDSFAKLPEKKMEYSLWSWLIVYEALQRILDYNLPANDFEGELKNVIDMRL
ncbi:hypothetical protein H0A36_23760 [Endozoicomonas sp. SM1973]|uniref:Uncharacterized protein n=1 Tax=Spartinivicinus marinus TaxID=2994442 RepID=A0A853IGC4_9GAMM|nr:hypothetical protein [Spartinivicinus marinus]MCX4027818.1 hypothetical protein [Spartinivicinus marinus]NYZ69041.1 hypothetical protein [Spartinivicinus marinus]